MKNSGRKYDILIIGSGIAGLTLAIKASSFARVCIITKSSPNVSNTNFAQGGIAAVMSKTDSFEKHIHDTLTAGAGLCNEKIVETAVRSAPERISELMNWGAEFNMKKSGAVGMDYHEPDLAREGGHSENRVVHAKDMTGREVERALLEKASNNPNIEILAHHFAIEIITQHHLGKFIHHGTPGIKCFGVYALNEKNGQVEKIIAQATILSTGGIGQVYAFTTNPPIATGDGIAMAYRANAKIANMEFIQFHPTALYHPGESPAFLISEALRGFGGVLKNKSGEEFMQKYDTRGSLAPRDIVARAIDSEMKKSGDEYVSLDVRHKSRDELKKNFPNIFEHCLKSGIDISKQMIPVVPAAHYVCGGVQTDEWGRTSIENLFACGECACTGMHGANRLASNSLLEALVFAHCISEFLKDKLKLVSDSENIPDWNDSGTTHPEEWILISQNFKDVQTLMSNHVGIVRSDLRLEQAAKRINLIYDETEKFFRKTKVSQKLCELRNIITCAFLIIKSAQLRKESRGLHFTTDEPNTNDEYKYDTVL